MCTTLNPPRVPHFDIIPEVCRLVRRCDPQITAFFLEKMYCLPNCGAFVKQFHNAGFSLKRGIAAPRRCVKPANKVGAVNYKESVTYKRTVL